MPRPSKACFPIRCRADDQQDEPYYNILNMVDLRQPELGYRWCRFLFGGNVFGISPVGFLKGHLREPPVRCYGEDEERVHGGLVDGYAVSQNSISRLFEKKTWADHVSSKTPIAFETTAVRARFPFTEATLPSNFKGW